MRAVVYDHYGPPDVLRVEEVEQPVPKDDELLVKVQATTVNRTDSGWRQASPWFARYFIGWRRPRRAVLGMELAGEVVSRGSGVREFEVGDAVFGIKGFGAHAEYATIREAGAVAHKPSGTSFEEAAAVCDGACIALSCLRVAQPLEGKRVLVYGASGSVGTAAVQLAKHSGAHVTAVLNTKNLDLARSLGADEAIDYLHQDFWKNGQTYDVIFDAYGRLSYRRTRRSLSPEGMWIGTDLGFLWHFPLVALLSRRAKLGIAKYRKEDVLLLKSLLESGEYRAVIDRTYPLEEVVAAATYVDTGQKTGNVVLTLNGGAAR
jgi:NADPH:quinone reductase-like Zn-dependent oxidoreductase